LFIKQDGAVIEKSIAAPMEEWVNTKVGGEKEKYVVIFPHVSAIQAI
jgi:hypothetical protein